SPQSAIDLPPTRFACTSWMSCSLMSCLSMGGPYSRVGCGKQDFVAALFHEADVRRQQASGGIHPASRAAGLGVIDIQRQITGPAGRKRRLERTLCNQV